MSSARGMRDMRGGMRGMRCMKGMRDTRGFYVRLLCGIFDGYMNFHRSSLNS